MFHQEIHVSIAHLIGRIKSHSVPRILRGWDMFEMMALDSDSCITLHNISHMFLKELKLSVDLCSYFVLFSLEFQWLGIAFKKKKSH